MAYDKVDSRDITSKKFPVIRDEVTITVASGAATGETTVALNGTIRWLDFILPALGGDTAKLGLEDEDNTPLTTDTPSEAQSDTYQYARDCDVAGDVTFKITCSGNQAAERTFTVKYRGR